MFEKASMFQEFAGRSVSATWAAELVVALSLCVATSTPIFAVDDVWLSTPGSGNWNKGTNWSTERAPAAGDTATFNTSSQTSLSLSSSVTVASITFNPGANAFTIDTNMKSLSVEGTGILNNSGKTQTINDTGGTLKFLNASSAGSVMINNIANDTDYDGPNPNYLKSDGDDALTLFESSSTADKATITNGAGLAAGGVPTSNGGSTTFLNSSNGGSAMITNNGGTTSGAPGGFTQFFNTSSAGSATITSEGGTNGGSGGYTQFFQSSDGGTARAITNGNGSFDISGLTITGMGIGSIEGSGNYLLGSKILTVGGNNLSTTVSGVIQDGGIDGGTGGSLTKVGTGTLMLTGTNTYSGGTNLNGGILAVKSDVNLGTGPLSFDGGTLESAADGGGITSSKPITLNALGGTFLGDAGTRSALSGTISGTGDLVKTGAGWLTLSGINSYSGGTMISGGTLQAGSATGLSANSDFTVNSILDLNGFNSTIGSLSGTGTVLSSVAGTVTLTVGNDNGSSTFAGVLEDGTGVLRLTKSGTGTLTLTEANNYTGGTTINAGTLQLGDGGTSGSIAGNVSDNGTLAFDRSDAVTFGGVISGTGNVVKLGSGTLTFTGANTYTGGTTISGGTLLVGGGGITGSIAGNVVDNGTLAFNRSNAVTFGGVISGTGDVVKLGTGTLTLTSANTYTGSTTVDSGSLIVDGSTMSAQTVVNSGAFLGGHGTIGGNLVNSGTVGQINSPGTLTVTGDYTQNQGGTLRIEVAGVATGQHDLLAVGGHATLGGTLQLISLGGFSLRPGNQITFLTAANGISGTFSNTQNGLVSTGTVVLAQITTTSDSAVLVATEGLFADIPGVAINPNELAVAKALDSARGDPREAALFAFLNSQPLANLPHDLTLIAPTQVTSINATAVSVGKVQVSNVGQRLANIRGGSNGFSSAGFSISGGAASIGEGFAGVSGPEGKSGPAAFAPTPDNRWGVFVTGLGEFSNVDSTPDAAGYDVNTGGVTFGVDYRLTPNFAIGLTGGYAHTSVGLDGGGNIDVNGGKLGLYATLFGNGFYLDTAATGGPSGYTTHRAALQGTASGSIDGADFNALIAVGYDWTKGNLSIGPTASFQYGYIGLNSFTETGSLAPLKFPDQNTESERSAFGAKASYQWKLSHVTVIPQVSAAWQHEYGDTAYSIVSGFATGAGKSFTVTGPDIGRDSILVGAGATVIWNDRVSTYLYYDGEFARTNYLSNNVSGGVRITF